MSDKAKGCTRSLYGGLEGCRSRIEPVLKFDRLRLWCVRVLIVLSVYEGNIRTALLSVPLALTK